MEEATNTTFLQNTKTFFMCIYKSTFLDDFRIKMCSCTSRSDVVSRIKNMLMIPRYLMMRVPGRKDTGVIFTTGTELPPNERMERSERERPSGSGLLRSRDDTVGSERESKHRSRRERCEKKTRKEEEGKKDNREWRYKKHSKLWKMKSRYELWSRKNANVKCVLKCNPVITCTVGLIIFSHDCTCAQYMWESQLSMCLYVQFCGCEVPSLRKRALPCVSCSWGKLTRQLQCLQTDRQTWAQLCTFTCVNTVFQVQWTTWQNIYFCLHLRKREMEMDKDSYELSWAHVHEPECERSSIILQQFYLMWPNSIRRGSFRATH